MKKIIIIILLLFISGCKKNELLLNEFIDKGNFNGYIIEENKKGYENYTYIKNIYYAINRQNMYDIQFLELESDDYAKRFFSVNKEEFIKLKNNNTYIKSLDLSNYNMYHLENDEKYLLVIRSRNNILYINAPINYINEIEEFLEELDLDF